MKNHGWLSWLLERLNGMFQCFLQNMMQFIIKPVVGNIVHCTAEWQLLKMTDIFFVTTAELNYSETMLCRFLMLILFAAMVRVCSKMHTHPAESRVTSGFQWMCVCPGTAALRVIAKSIYLDNYQELLLQKFQQKAHLQALPPLVGVWQSNRKGLGRQLGHGPNDFQNTCRL